MCTSQLLKMLQSLLYSMSHPNFLFRQEIHQQRTEKCARQATLLNIFYIQLYYFLNLINSNQLLKKLQSFLYVPSKLPVSTANTSRDRKLCSSSKFFHWVFKLHTKNRHKASLHRHKWWHLSEKERKMTRRHILMFADKIRKHRVLRWLKTNGKATE